MKVSTDACLFGAWVTSLFNEAQFKVLDVGTGTGLLSLMWLQEHPKSSLVALEPNLIAAKEAANNFNNNGQSARITITAKSLEDFALENVSPSFNLIISNPPFFQNHLEGKDTNRNLSRHNTLDAETLAEATRGLALESGKLAVLYPANLWDNWLQAAGRYGWQAESVLIIQPTALKPANRVCGLFSLNSGPIDCRHEKIIIRHSEGIYSERFRQLLKPYYLNF